MKKTGHKVLSLCCVLMLLCCTLMMPTTHAETAAERYERLKGELEDISAQIEDYKNNKAAAVQQKQALVQQKEMLDEMIALNKQRIADTQVALQGKEQEVADKRAVIYENEQLFGQRLVAMYKMKDSNMLSMVLNVNTFSELLTVINSLQRISVHDTELISLLNQQREDLEVEQAEIDRLLQELNDAYAEQEATAAVLAQNIAAQDAAISAADANLQAEQAAYDGTYADLKAAQKEMEEIARQVSSTGSTSTDGSEYVGGTFTWPVPNFYDISCYFGAPDPNGIPHRGMDIRGNGITGASIVAAGGGTVIISASAHGSYGNYIVVDHGNGIKTLYAHCQSLLVGVGTPVSAGTPIATVGSTGFVTGAHLHFEVQKDGGVQNPLNYLKA